MSDRARSLDEARVRIVRGLRSRQGTIEHAIWDRIRNSVPHAAGSGDGEYEAGQLEAITAIVSYGLDAIERGPAWSDPIPPAAAAQARRAARVGVSLGTIQRRYLAGHCEFGEFVTKEIERNGLANDGEAIHHLRRTQEGLLEQLVAAIEREYNQEHDLIAGSLRSGIVRRLLAGEAVGQVELAELDYEIHTSWHVGIVAAGAGVEDIVRNLRENHARKFLCVHLDGRMCVWLSAQAVDVTRLSCDGNVELPVGVGEPGIGYDGWRLTYNQARAAFAVALHKVKNVAWYANDRLLAAALENDTLALSLTQRYLIPLNGQSDGGVKLYNTLRNYIELECNATSTAHRLRVGRHTVESRIHTVEQLIGCSLRECLAELDVALRLVELSKSVDPRAQWLGGGVHPRHTSSIGLSGRSNGAHRPLDQLC